MLRSLPGDTTLPSPRYLSFLATVSTAPEDDLLFEQSPATEPSSDELVTALAEELTEAFQSLRSRRPAPRPGISGFRRLATANISSGNLTVSSHLLETSTIRDISGVTR